MDSRVTWCIAALLCSLRMSLLQDVWLLVLISLITLYGVICSSIVSYKYIKLCLSKMPDPRTFYRATRMHSADYAMARCLSVRLSVCHTPVLCANGYTYPQSFLNIWYSSTILVFSYQTGWQYSDGDPLTGASNARGYEKSRFATNIGLYLRIDAWQSHSYYESWIGNRTPIFRMAPSWMTLSVL